MINEPTAASLAYAYKSLENTEKKIIVIDFGGGTLDLTLLNYRKNKDGIYCDVKFTYRQVLKSLSRSWVNGKQNLGIVLFSNFIEC